MVAIPQMRLSIGMAALTILALSTGIFLSETACAQISSDAAVRAYWTPERLRNAIPMRHYPSNPGPDGYPMPSGVSSGTSAYAPMTNGPNRSSLLQLPSSASGSAPTVANNSDALQLYRPKTNTQASGITPDATNTYNQSFTTFRVFPRDGANAAVKNYPYSAVGHLFFTVTKSGGIDTPGDYQCTASVIRLRIVITAGHCVGSPVKATGGHFFWYTNWIFIPADINGAAPFGSWTSFSQGASGPWVNGNGSFPNSEDWGFLAMNDKGTTKVGTLTGNFGYISLALSAANLTTLGYPGNLDSGAYMEENNGTTNANGNNNTWTIGSAMGRGSSGGPWLLNFGQAPNCNGPCLSANGSLNTLGGNYLVAVDSYGPTNQVGYSGASQFNADWTTLLTTMCKKKAGSC
jgi:V8-like Glu-specific endopeptidase